MSIKRTYDPSQTTVLRNTFAKDMRKLFNELIKVIYKSVYTNDCFKRNLNVNMEATDNVLGTSDSENIEYFLLWLQNQINIGILEKNTFQKYWTNKYVYEAYIRGLQRARKDMIKNGMDVQSIENITTEISSGTFHNDTVNILYSRVYNELKAITDDLMNKVSLVLSQGMLKNDNAKTLALEIIAVINGLNKDMINIGQFVPSIQRAELLARTNIIRAFAEAQLREYENWGVYKLGVMAEILTAGDDKVCEKCYSLEGKVYTIEEAKGLIPFHPSCRCIWILIN